MKRKSIWIFIIVVTILSFSAILYACDKPPADNIENKNPLPPPPPIVYFDYSNLNYNPEYNNPSAPQEKGFIIYDNIDLSLVTFSEYTIRPPAFIITLDNKEIMRVEKTGTVYNIFSPQMPGTYVVQVVASNSSKNLGGSFEINVSSGNYPTGVELSVKSLSGTSVSDKITAGDTNIFSGKRTVMGKEIDTVSGGWDSVYLYENALDTHNRKPIWQREQESYSDEITLAIPNLVLDGIIKLYYRYEIVLPNGNVVSNSATFDIPISNNYSHLSFDLSGEEGNIFNVPYSHYNFLDAMNVFFNFTNGDKEEASLSLYKKDAKLGSVIPYIKYEGEDTYQPYTGVVDINMNDFEGIFGDIRRVYKQNGARYCFPPNSTGAELYFAYHYREDFQGGFRTKDKPLEDSDFSLMFTKDTPTSISLDVASGSEMEENLSRYTYDIFIPFSNRPVINGKLEVKVAVTDLNYNTSFDASKQHFKITPIVNGSSDTLKDFYFEFRWKEINYNSNKNYFYFDEEGETEIKIVSCHDESISYTLTVNFVNPVIKKELIYAEDVPNMFLHFNPREILKVKDTFYNRKPSPPRDLMDDEVLRFVNGKDIYTNPLEIFPHRNQRYHNNYEIRLYDNESQPVIDYLSRVFISNMYIMPDFTIEIDGIDYLMSGTTTYTRQSSIYENGKYKFVGDIPLLEALTINADSIILKDGNGYNIDSSIASIRVEQDNTISVLYHRFYEYNKSVTYKNVKIAQISFAVL